MNAQRRIGVILLAAVLVSIVLTSLVAASLTIVEDSIKIGSETQPRSNPRADAEDSPTARNVFARTTFTLQNNGTTTITNLLPVVSEVVPRTGDEAYQFRFTNLPASGSLAAGEQVTVTIEGRIPKDLDAVNRETLKPAAQLVANLKVRGTDSTGAAVETELTPVNMQAINMLRLDDVDICFQNNCESADDGDNVKDVKPGDIVEARITIENEYSDSDEEDLEIDDVKIRIEIKDRDARTNERETLGSISPDDTDEETITFEIDEKANHGTVDMTIEVQGQDENGAWMGERWTVDLEITRENHDLPISDVIVTPSVLSCTGAKTVQTDVQYRNIGRKDEKKVAVEVKVPKMNIVTSQKEIEVGEDDRESQTLTFTVPEDAKPGVYEVEVRTFYDNNKLSDIRQSTVTVPDCDEEFDSDADNRETRNARDADEDEERNDRVVVVPSPTQPSTPTVPTPRTPTTPVDDESVGLGYLVGLGAVVLILLVVLVVLLVVLFRKKH
ncbi:hypothetical protein HYS47_01100 [Candidatus Woesearchaeota archaeon]|nr:hypothetical protein [Candidatus Woesearchaeota archaeon]